MALQEILIMPPTLVDILDLLVWIGMTILYKRHSSPHSHNVFEQQIWIYFILFFLPLWKLLGNLLM